MAWIKFEKDRLTDPRMLRMARRLCEKGLRYPFDTVTHERHSERDIRYAVTLLAGAWVTLWVYADTHIGADDVLQMGVPDVDRLAGLDGFCELAPPEWLEIIDADSLIKLPGYQEHNGVEQRRKDQAALRMQRYRERQRNDSVTEASPDKTKTKTKTRPRREEKQKPPASSAEALSAAGKVNGNAIAYIPLNDGTEFGVSQELVAELSNLYPAVDVPQTLNEIRGWNISHPAKRKTRKGVLAHINSWMSKEQNRG